MSEGLVCFDLEGFKIYGELPSPFRDEYVVFFEFHILRKFVRKKVRKEIDFIKTIDSPMGKTVLKFIEAGGFNINRLEKELLEKVSVIETANKSIRPS